MKVILTGHSQGLGRAMADALLGKGIAVLGISRSSEPRLIKTYPSLLIEEQFDLADSSALEVWLSGGRLNAFLQNETAPVLINNAGTVLPIGKAGAQSNSEIAKAVALNVSAALMLTNQFLADTGRAADRRVVHISSGAARSPYAGWNVYCATKAALDHHARCLAIENHSGLRVSSIAPGIIDTGMQAQIRASSLEQFPLREKFDELKATGSLVAPEAAAERLLAYLFSESFGSEPCVDSRQIKP